MQKMVVEDLGTLKALAHPLRLSAMGELRKNGPATASELGRALGESSGSLSYHLRQLERYGFVADDVHRDGRERRWRAVHEATQLPRGLAETPEGRAALDVVKGVQQRELLEQLRAAQGEPTGPTSHSDYLLHLDVEDLDELTAELDAVIVRYRERRGAHQVAVHVVAAPTVKP
ncbi:helix-turn-helix domain-containing protein [Aeromicrobium sp. CTD01-1L150]|uniref:helix-turn-helix domain-containing protein n=1 Tax=Aeromicrobium sp. CTD01-1L150 TaxID=3341830 RepID=UPI0035C18F1C